MHGLWTAALVIFVVALLASLWTTPPMGVVAPLLALAIITWLRRSRDSLAIYADRVILRRPDRGDGEYLSLSPWDIGHLVQIGGRRLRRQFGLRVYHGGTVAELRVEPRQAAAEIDTLIENLTKMTDLFVCSIETAGRIRYSRSWSLLDVVSWQRLVTEATLERGADIVVRIEGRSYTVYWELGYLLQRPNEAGGVSLLQVDRERVRLFNGMVLGFVRDGNRIRMGSGEDRFIDLTGGVFLAESRVGELRRWEGGLHLSLQRELPELLLATVLLVVAIGTRRT